LGTDGTRRLFGDGTLRVDLTVAAAAVLALAGTGWLIRDELRHHSDNGEEIVAVGVAESIIGSAKRRSGASLVWTRLDIGEQLERGDGLFVAEDSALDVHFLDGSHLLVSESSLVVVDLPGAAAGAQARVDVRHGSVSGEAGTRGLLFEVHGSSVSLAGGGVASVSGGGDVATRVSVEKGEARVQDPGGGAAQVGAKQTTVVSEGRVEAVRDLTIALDEPGSGDSVYFTGEAAAVPFAWSGGAGVLEVADDMTFVTVVRRRAATVGITVRLTAGSYFWRVSDDDGEPLSAARVLNVVRDDPPALLQPATDSVVYLANEETATFAWSRVAGVARYRVEIAAAEDFGVLAFSAEVDGTHLRFGERLPEGDYYWRVRSLAPERGESPWTVQVPFKLAVEPLPRAPELYDSEVEVIEGGSNKGRKAKPQPKPDEGANLLYRLFVGGVAHAAAPSAAIILRWEAVPGVRRYVLEIAEDEAFTTVVVREELTENWYRWRTISKREYWWRVKSIDAKGREGVFSRPRSVGAVLSAPRLLAPKPVETIQIGADVPNVQFTWEDQRLAGRYQWSIAVDAAFSRGVVTKTTSAPKLDWKPSGAGTMFWRVRAADAGGSYTGYSKTHRLEVTLAAPVARSTVGDVLMSSPPPKVKLAARPVATAGGYEVQVASEPSFAQPIVSAKTTAPRWVFEPEVAGIWWWRWRAHSRAIHSPWGKPVSLDVRVAQPVISAPVAGARVGFRASEGTSIDWLPGPGAAGYEVVVSADGSEVARVQASAPPVVIPGLAVGAYSVRVRALRASGPAVESEPIAFELVALPPLAAPSPMVPAVNAWLATAESRVDVRFGWDVVDGAAAYELEVAAAGGDWARTREQGVAGARTELLRGAYSWRVRAVDDAGMPGPYSEAVAFRVGPSPPTTAIINIEPEPVTPADAEVRIDISLRDGDGQPVVGAEVEASAMRGSIHDLRDAGGGRYVARYQPPSDFDAGEDTVAVTVPGLTTFRVEEPLRLKGAAGWGLLLGGSVGLVSNFEAVLSPTVQLEAGYRLPWLRGRLIATLRAGYHYARKTREEEPRATANQYSIPIALGLKLEFPYWLVVPYGSANVLFGVMVGRLKVVGQDEIFRTELGLGADVGVGGALAFGPGDLFTEVRFGWMRGANEDGLFELDGGGLVPVVGYRVEL